jgi:flavin-dependent dehydrogenase
MTLTAAVIGGGPAGAACAWRLARAGVRTLLFERDPEREKPCGGGLTERAFVALPELRDLSLPWLEVCEWQMFGPYRQSVTMNLGQPVRILSRRELDGALRREAAKAGAALVFEPVRRLAPRVGGGWQINDHAADVVVGAGGMRDPVAQHVGMALKREEQAVALGRFVPGRFPPRIITSFLPERRGYLWWFPRPDHASYGLELPATRFDTATAKKILQEFAAKHLPGVDVNQGAPYGWTGPAVAEPSDPLRRYAGPDWLLVGDAAGLCDGTTGEGLSYALASGVLAAEAIARGEPASYERRLRADVLPDLTKAAHLQPKFYRPRLLAMAMWLLKRSPTYRQISRELAHGRQNYLTLRERTLGNGPRICWEALQNRVDDSPEIAGKK